MGKIKTLLLIMLLIIINLLVSNEVFSEKIIESDLPYLNNEKLYLKISDLNNFGIHEIERNKKTVYASFQNDFELLDSRKKSFGYDVTVEATPFKIAEPKNGWIKKTDYQLPIGSMFLNKVETIQTIDSKNNPPSFNNSSVILDIGQAFNLIRAYEGTGTGHFKFNFGQQALGLVIDPTTAKIDKVNYPNSSTIYESTITWNLVTSVNMDDLKPEPVLPENEQSNIDDFIYIVYPDYVTIIGYRGKNRDILIPSKIEGKTVKYIHDNAFYPKVASADRGNSSVILRSVKIPNTVESIGKYAFYANQLTELVIPDSVTFMDEGAFYNNAINKLTLPKNITTLNPYVFHSNQLTEIAIHDNIEYIGKFAFTSNQLRNIQIGSKVYYIGEEAFSSNPFEYITIPANVQVVGLRVFAYNYNLKEVTDKSKNITNVNKSSYISNNATIKN